MYVSLKNILCPINVYRFTKEILLMVKIQSDFMKFGQRSHGYYMYKLGPFSNTNVTYTY